MSKATTASEPRRSSNVIVLSDAGKLIYHNYGNNENDDDDDHREEKVLSLCSLVQAIRTSLGDEDELQVIRSARGNKLVFWAVGALTLISHSPDEHEAFLKLQLEHLYGQIVFTLTNHFQTMFQHSPNLDLNHTLGSSTEDVLSSILDQAVDGDFLTAGIRTCPLPNDVREFTAHTLLAVCEEIPNTLFALLTVSALGDSENTGIPQREKINANAEERDGGMLVSLVQPSKREHQLTSSDLFLLVNFCNHKTANNLSSELWFPVCLPRFHASGFLYVYMHCLDAATQLRLILVSPENTTDQFEQFRQGAIRLRQQLDLPEQQESDILHICVNDEISDSTSFNDEAWKANNGNEQDTVPVHHENGDGFASKKGGLDEMVRQEEVELPTKRAAATATAEEPPCALLQALYDAPTALDEFWGTCCRATRVLHFAFRDDVPIHGRRGRHSHHNRKDNQSHRFMGSSGYLVQSLVPPFSMTINKGHYGHLNSNKVWAMYEKLALRLRLNCASTNVTLNAIDDIASNEKQENLMNCPATRLWESTPQSEGMTYVLDGGEIYVGLSGKDFELYAILPSTIPPTTATSFCAKLVRQILEKEHELFISNPLTWR